MRFFLLELLITAAVLGIIFALMRWIWKMGEKKAAKIETEVSEDEKEIKNG